MYLLASIFGAENFLIVLGLVALIIFGVSYRSSGGGTRGAALVLRQFTVGIPADGGTVIQIVGRQPGLIAWLLTSMGFSAETTLTVNDEDISFRSSSLSGQTHQVVLLSKVSSTHCGYNKPIAALIFGVLLVLTGFIMGLGSNSAMALLLCLIFGGLCFLVYFLSKSVQISIETFGGTYLGLRFKPSVVEGISVDIQKVQQAIHLLNQLIAAAQATQRVKV